MTCSNICSGCQHCHDTQHLHPYTNTSCYTHSHMYASWHRYREWVTTYWPPWWSWSSVQIRKRKSIVHTHTWIHKHTQLLTGHHDGLWVPSQTVLEQPSQHRVTIRDERLLPPFDWIRHIRWTNKTIAHSNITWSSSENTVPIYFFKSAYLYSLCTNLELRWRFRGRQGNGWCSPPPWASVPLPQSHSPSHCKRKKFPHYGGPEQRSCNCRNCEITHL